MELEGGSMQWLTLVFCWILACGTCSGQAVSTGTQTATPQLDLIDLPDVVSDLVSRHPSKKEIDEQVLLRSHDKLFALFDPDKIYLLEEEVEPFVHPNNGRRFFKEYQQKDLSAYRAILNLCRTAVMRCRTIRTGFLFTDSQTLNRVRTEPMPTYDRYASDRTELTKRIFQKYARLIVERLPMDAEEESQNVRNAVMVAERAFEDHETSWLEVDMRPEAPQERRALAARLILKSLLSSLDTHSDVMECAGVREIRERLTKESFGTGIVVRIGATGCVVQKIIRGSPADLSGTIRVGDRIVAINHRPCSEMSASEINALLNEETAGSVFVAFIRQGQKRMSVTLSRQRYTMLEGRVEVDKRPSSYGTIAIITLHAFYRGGSGVSSAEDVRKALVDASAHGPLAAIILDLRDNSGGYITEAVRVVGQFIKTGVVMTAWYADGSRLVFRDIDPDIVFSGPMIVLTSRATASAAEIVTQALKDYGRAIIVGDPTTYGKGSIQMQTVTDVQEKGAWVNIPLRFTVGRFYSVSGYSPQQVGVTADIVVPGMYNRAKAEEEAESGRLKEKIDPLFHDSLDDVRLEVKGWYQEHYLPFVQEHTDLYRRWIPTLKKKSEYRMKNSPLWSLLNRRAVAPQPMEALRKQVNALQLAEAVAIAEDLIRLSRDSSVERKQGK